MERYRVIDHPSDIGIEAFGKDKKELFENAAFGMMDMMFDLPDVKQQKVLNFRVSNSIDLESLLVSWLSELLSISDIRKLACRDFKIVRMTDTSLEAIAGGGKIGRVKTGIKAVTYSQMKIEEKNGVWSTRIIFDV
jgi:SHS2 domain-containing protein